MAQIALHVRRVTRLIGVFQNLAVFLGHINSLTLSGKSLRFSPLRLARWCNGSTADSGSVCHGSNPCRAANFLDARSSNTRSFAAPQYFVRFLVETPSWKASLHIITGAVPQPARHSTNSTVNFPSFVVCAPCACGSSPSFAEVLVQLVGAAQRAAQRAADLEMVLADRGPAGTSGRRSPAHRR